MTSDDKTKGLLRTALWTEVREAIQKDFPDLHVPNEAPGHLAQMVVSNADYMFELVSKLRVKK